VSSEIAKQSHTFARARTLSNSLCLSLPGRDAASIAGQDRVGDGGRGGGRGGEVPELRTHPRGVYPGNHVPGG